MKETNYFVKAYDQNSLDSQSLSYFQDEIYRIMKLHAHLSKNMSFLDLGCGKGHFLHYLQQKGHKNLMGMDPCKPLRDNRCFDNIIDGSYENNSFEGNSFDIVFTSHTLHHLPNKWPLYAVNEILRITRKYIVIIESNNSNLPMLLRNLLYRNNEKNAFRYNVKRVQSMLNRTKCRVIYSDHIKSCFMSANSLVYRVMAKMGRPPYNISIAAKDTRGSIK